MHISLLIATIHRRDELDRLLCSLRAQSYSHVQVCIADQNPQAFLESVIQAHSPHLSITRLPLPPCGVSAARNALLPLAVGDIIAFPDDDCWYEPDTLAAVVDFFAAHPHCDGMLATWVESSKYSSPSKNPPSESSPSENLPHKNLAPKKLSLRGMVKALSPFAAIAGKVKALSPYAAIAGSETYVQFYRRAVVRTVGNFDPNLGPGTGLPWGCGEDSDYVLRAIAHNYRLCRAPSVRVHHPLPALIAPASATPAAPLAAAAPAASVTPAASAAPPAVNPASAASAAPLAAAAPAASVTPAAPATPAAPLALDLAKYHSYALGRMYLLKKHAFPLWFRLLNVLYPLLLLPLDTLRQGRVAAQYRWAMFTGRLRGLFL